MLGLWELLGLCIPGLVLGCLAFPVSMFLDCATQMMLGMRSQGLGFRVEVRQPANTANCMHARKPEMTSCNSHTDRHVQDTLDMQLDPVRAQEEHKKSTKRAQEEHKECSRRAQKRHKKSTGRAQGEHKESTRRAQGEHKESTRRALTSDGEVAAPCGRQAS